MDSTRLPQRNTGFAALRRFASGRAPAERCELCGTPLPAEHGHLIEPPTRRLACACEPCALLFAGAAETKFRRVPRRVRLLRDFRMDDAQWDAMAIPINLAFFYYSTPAARVLAVYPSPAGATESLLGLEAWDEIVGRNPVLARMEPDVEALLVKRISRTREAAGAEYYLAPIDECFKLVGLIRARWRGLSGGAEVWEEIAAYFDGLRQRASVYGERPRA